MAGCCDHNDLKFDGVSAEYKRILIIIIAANATMFLVEMVAGVKANSMALLADALDFLGDSVTYALTLWAIGKPLATRAKTALIKGVSLSLMAAWILGATVYQVMVLEVPNQSIMGVVAIMALCVNVGSALLLLKFRDGDSNVRSVWLCSRNDAIGNVAVLGAAGLVLYTGTAWPDLVVATLMASLFLQSSIKIIRQARSELREPQTAPIANPQTGCRES